MCLTGHSNSSLIVQSGAELVASELITVVTMCKPQVKKLSNIDSRLNMVSQYRPPTSRQLICV